MPMDNLHIVFLLFCNFLTCTNDSNDAILISDVLNY